jgi:lactate permease
MWKPREHFHLEGSTEIGKLRPKHALGEILLAWSPYLLLVGFVLIWGQDWARAILNKVTVAFPWPGLHNLVERVEPVVKTPSPYAAVYTFNWLSAAGTACLVAVITAMIVLRASGAVIKKVFVTTCKQLALSELTIASVLALAFLLNYCGATATLGLAFAATGVLFPFFSALLGWLGVFLTGSDTSANALFGNLQVITANRLGLDPILMASSNSSGGVMGKMISLQSIAVAAAATGMKPEEEAKLFRFTLRHSILLASLIGLVTVFYAYVMPQWAH